ncbi:MAG: hypothetical protein SFU98_11035, partial [Leptospiraceae bacterium]|nr:hypothetical protein [Leptospiraceae bacterium]
MKKSEIDTPPEQGAEYFFITSETERTPTFVIGKNVGNIVTKCSNIEEDHLVFQFKKDPLNEEYTITIKRHGSVLFKPPRMAHYAVMAASEKLESHEVIGKKAEFRISNKMIKERMS